MATSKIWGTFLRSRVLPSSQPRWIRPRPLPLFLQRRPASYQHFPGRGGRRGPLRNDPEDQSPYDVRSTYSGQRVDRFQRIWQAHGNKILILGAGGLVFYVYNLETVPVSGRRRFNCISDAREEAMGRIMYRGELQDLQGRLLPANHPLTQRVAKVVERLLPASGLGHQQWAVHVVDDPDVKNAFVIAGGKVFIFTGMIDFVRDDDGLAAVLGHEIAHNVCHHTAEKISDSIVVLALAMILSLTYDVSGGTVQWLFHWIYSLPQGRKQEAEADEIGLSMMAQSCYDPKAAYHLWKRMEETDKDKIPQFMSTHPSHANRMGHIQKLLPQTQAQAEASDCSSLRGYRDRFHGAFQNFGKEFW